MQSKTWQTVHAKNSKETGKKYLFGQKYPDEHSDPMPPFPNLSRRTGE